MEKVHGLHVPLCALFLLIASPTSPGSNEAEATVPEKVVASAASYLDVREATGNNDGVHVQYFLSTVGLGKGHAWCGAFAYACHLEGGIRPAGKPSSFAWVPTWFPQERVTWKWQAVGRRSDGIRPGMAFGLYFPSKKRVAHVGIVESIDASGLYIWSIEGNTNSMGSREGDGVYRKRRALKDIWVVSDWIEPLPLDK